MAIEVKFISPDAEDDYDVVYPGVYIIIDGVRLLSAFEDEQAARAWLEGVDWTTQVTVLPPTPRSR